MTNERWARHTASLGAALVFGTAGFHLSAYGSVTARAPVDLRPLMGALWVAGGVSLILAALLVVAVTPVFIVRRRALLAIAALTPLSIAILQVAYLGFLPPTALLLVDTAVLLTAGQLGRRHQPVPAPAA
jgi:hypothetical protein